MKSFPAIGLSLFLVACLAPQPHSVGAESASKESTPNCVQSVQAQPRPPQVQQVFPTDKSASTDLLAIGADLDLTVGEEIEPNSLRLLVNGVDVTSQAQIGGTRDWPPSFLQISYNLKDLQQGTHCAEVQFQTKQGKTISYNWSFSVSPRQER